MPALDRLGGAINDRWGKLDILVANAAILGVISPIGHVEAKTFEKVMTINVVDLAADPLGRPAAAPVGCRPRHHPFLQRRAFRAGLLGAVRGVESGGGDACALLGRRDAQYGAPRQRLRSWPDPHRHACASGPRRGSETVPHPSEIAAKMLLLASPALTETGLIYQASTEPLRCVPAAGIIQLHTSFGVQAQACDGLFRRPLTLSYQTCDGEMHETHRVFVAALLAAGIVGRRRPGQRP